MKTPTALVIPALALIVGCANNPPRAEIWPVASSNSVLRADRLQSMGGMTALDALQTLATYMNRTIRQPTPHFVLIFDGSRTSNLDMLRGIQASEVYEIRVVGESQSLGIPGQVEIVVTTLARHDKAGEP